MITKKVQQDIAYPVIFSYSFNIGNARYKNNIVLFLFDSLQETMIRSVRQAVKDEVSSAVQEQGATISSNVLDAMRSGAVTPAPVSPDPQHAKSHIMQLLRQGQLNAAFQQVNTFNKVCYVSL